MTFLRPSNIVAIGRDKLFWIMIGALVVAQLAAFWMLCRQQVLNAQAREAVVQVERMAMAECLRHVPRASSGNCAPRMAARENHGDSGLAAGDAGGVMRASMSSALPVNFTLR
jgi:hypothetical protein